MPTIVWLIMCLVAMFWLWRKLQIRIKSAFLIAGVLALAGSLLIWFMEHSVKVLWVGVRDIVIFVLLVLAFVVAMTMFARRRSSQGKE